MYLVWFVQRRRFFEYLVLCPSHHRQLDHERRADDGELLDLWKEHGERAAALRSRRPKSRRAARAAAPDVDAILTQVRAIESRATTVPKVEPPGPPTLQPGDPDVPPDVHGSRVVEITTNWRSVGPNEYAPDEQRPYLVKTADGREYPWRGPKLRKPRLAGTLP